MGRLLRMQLQALTPRVQSHRKFQRAARVFVDEILTPDALAREEDGERPSVSVIQQMA